SGDRAMDRRAPRRRHPSRAARPSRLPHGRDAARRGSPTRASPELRSAAVELSTIDEAVRRIRRGEVVLAGDDEERENEGALRRAASWVTGEAVNFMLRWARGLVCMPCDAGRLDELAIEPMLPAGRATCDTAFCVSIDHASAGSGIGVEDRATTTRKVLDARSRAGHFLRPGHGVPLRARPARVLD